jgi:hypothetical protein
MIHPPSHLHYFDRKTIAQLLERCGFDVLEIKAIGVARTCAAAPCVLKC